MSSSTSARATTPPVGVAFTVLTDVNLFRPIVSFQAGWAQPVLLRWRELKPSSATGFVAKLLQQGDLATLNLAIRATWYRCSTQCQFSVVDLHPAIASGDPAVLQWALGWMSPSSGINSRALDLWIQAIKTFPGHFGVLELLLEQWPLATTRKSPFGYLFDEAPMPITLVQWLATNLGHWSLPSFLLKQVAFSGDMELVEYFSGIAGQRLSPSTFAQIYDRSVLMQEQQDSDEAHRLREVLEYLLRHSNDPHDYVLEEAAVANGDDELLCIILQARGLHYVTSDMVAAAVANGYQSTIRIIIDDKPDLVTSAVMDEAVIKCHLDILEYLYSTGSATCSSTAVNDAAANGRLEFVELIHKHNAASFSMFTMNVAASKQPWDVVDLLVDRHPEFSTVAVLLSAISADRLDLVQRYSGGMNLLQIQRLVYAAYRSGKTEIAQYLEARERQLVN